VTGGTVKNTRVEKEGKDGIGVGKKLDEVQAKKPVGSSPDTRESYKEV